MTKSEFLALITAWECATARVLHHTTGRPADATLDEPFTAWAHSLTAYARMHGFAAKDER